MNFKKEVRENLEGIRLQLATMNVELREHTKRSTNLEERVAPLEESHVFFNKLAKTLIAIMAILASSATVYHYLILK